MLNVPEGIAQVPTNHAVLTRMSQIDTPTKRRYLVFFRRAGSRRTCVRIDELPQIERKEGNLGAIANALLIAGDDMMKIYLKKYDAQFRMLL
mmetsp:Transcript_15044/g.34884  ORF Transcript_15044/g.34884 Transcript_15044/m.34884 type:complete len:92 (+) Transcript_15044:665-940(+)